MKSPTYASVLNGSFGDALYFQSSALGFEPWLGWLSSLWQHIISNVVVSGEVGKKMVSTGYISPRDLVRITGNFSLTEIMLNWHWTQHKANRSLLFQGKMFALFTIQEKPLVPKVWTTVMFKMFHKWINEWYHVDIHTFYLCLHLFVVIIIVMLINVVLLYIIMIGYMLTKQETTA